MTKWPTHPPTEYGASKHGNPPRTLWNMFITDRVAVLTSKIAHAISGETGNYDFSAGDLQASGTRGLKVRLSVPNSYRKPFGMYIGRTHLTEFRRDVGVPAQGMLCWWRRGADRVPSCVSFGSDQQTSPSAPTVQLTFELLTTFAATPKWFILYVGKVKVWALMVQFAKCLLLPPQKVEAIYHLLENALEWQARMSKR